jgi:4,5-DOPA dioxygenase extradiol
MPLKKMNSQQDGVTLPKPCQGPLQIFFFAHGETHGTLVTAMAKPKTIHDFGAFLKNCTEFSILLPETRGWLRNKNLVAKTQIGLDEKWGLDHGCWSVLKHLYPGAHIPVLQMSLDYNLSAQQHYDLAGELKALRRKGVLIVGSGNMVHNLSMVAWSKLNDNYGYDWAIEAGETMKKHILSGDHDQLIRYENQGRAFELAIPTPDHYLPLLYVLALKDEGDTVSIFNDKPVGGSLTMTSLKIE